MFAHARLVLSYGHLIHLHTHMMTRAGRFLVRSLIWWGPTTRWLDFIESRTYLRNTSDFVRRVLSDKIHRPFARCHLSVSERVALLMDHYQQMEKLFPKQTILSLVSGNRLELACIQSKLEAEQYTITISREMISQHQGELTVLMSDPVDKIHLTWIILNLCTDENGDLRVVANGIQGPGPKHKNRIVRVTRNLDGLRPKRAIIEVTCAIARALGAKSLLAIGKKNHVSQTKKKWQKRNRTDYDIFWEEFGPEPLPNGDYLMPLTIPRRDPEEVASKKRKQAIARYALLDKLAAEVEESIGKMRI